MGKDLIDKLLPDDYQNKELYHYTSQDGLIGIFENRKIWATNIFYLNDQQEFINGWKSFFETFEKYKKDGKFFNSFQMSIKQYFEHWKKIGLENLNDIDFGKVEIYDFQSFVFSLSVKPDDLNQWRAYAENASGFNIKFKINDEFFTKQTTHKDSIKNNLTKTDCVILIKRCIYESQEKHEIINSLLDYYYAQFESNVHNWQIDLYFDIITLSYFFKNENFRDEQEYRFLVIYIFDTYKKLNEEGTEKIQNKVKFRKGKSLIIPYIELDTIYSNIKGITIGPTPLKYHSIASMKRFIKNIMNESELQYFEPELSSVPYRTW